VLRDSEERTGGTKRDLLHDLFLDLRESGLICDFFFPVGCSVTSWRCRVLQSSTQWLLTPGSKLQRTWSDFSDA